MENSGKINFYIYSYKFRLGTNVFIWIILKQILSKKGYSGFRIAMENRVYFAVDKELEKIFLSPISFDKNDNRPMMLIKDGAIETSENILKKYKDDKSFSPFGPNGSKLREKYGKDISKRVRDLLHL